LRTSKLDHRVVALKQVRGFARQPNAPAKLRALSEKEASRQLQPVVRTHIIMVLPTIALRDIIYFFSKTSLPEKQAIEFASYRQIVDEWPF